MVSNPRYDGATFAGDPKALIAIILKEPLEKLTYKDRRKLN
jgi:hypothetical protein